MCTDGPGRSTVISNSSDDTWLVQPPSGVVPVQLGDVPLNVQTFRLLDLPGTVFGYHLEPGTSVTVTAAPRAVTLVIDKANQGRWATFSLMAQTTETAGELLPNLIKTESYRTATKTCLDAGGDFLTTAVKTRYNTQSLVDYLGLTTSSTRCASNLLIADNERQAVARRAGTTVTELKPVAFARQADRIAAFLDRLLRGAGSLAHPL
jgi:hypothetical protein